MAKRKQASLTDKSPESLGLTQKKGKENSSECLKCSSECLKFGLLFFNLISKKNVGKPNYN